MADARLSARISDGPHTDLVRRYLQAVLSGRKEDALEMILSRARDGLAVEEIYLHVLQPVQWEIGRLWQNDEITVAQEHYCTALTQLAMSQLYPYLFSGPRIGHTLVMTCIGGGLHEVGARMVADIFEARGWDTHFLGASTPVAGILSAVEEMRPHILGLSVTMPYGISEARRTVSAVRRSAAGRELRIIVGGRAFLHRQDRWQTVGADAYAADAVSAAETALGLIGAQDRRPDRS